MNRLKIWAFLAIFAVSTTFSPCIGLGVTKTPAKDITADSTQFHASLNGVTNVQSALTVIDGLPLSMVYPGVGIAKSTGSSWDSSIVDNSSNWNTAYGWGNHATQGYLKSETDPLSLHLDQGTPQYIINGTPVFSKGIIKANDAIGLFQIGTGDPASSPYATYRFSSLDRTASYGGDAVFGMNASDGFFFTQGNTSIQADNSATTFGGDSFYVNTVLGLGLSIDDVYGYNKFTGDLYVSTLTAGDVLFVGANGKITGSHGNGYSQVTYDPIYGILSAFQFVGSLNGNAATASVATQATLTYNDSSGYTWPLVWGGSSSTGSYGLYNSNTSHVGYTPSTGTISATNFSGGGSLLTNLPMHDTYAFVSGSNATTTGQTLTAVTGLTAALAANHTYEFEAVMSVASTLTLGTEYGVNYSQVGATVEAQITASITSNAVRSYRINAFHTATVAVMTAAQDGAILIKGLVVTGANAGNFTIEHLKVTTGTSTVYINSFLRTRQIA